MVYFNDSLSAARYRTAQCFRNGEKEETLECRITNETDHEFIISVPLKKNAIRSHFYDPDACSLHIWYERSSEDEQGSSKFLVPKDIKDINIYE